MHKKIFVNVVAIKLFEKFISTCCISITGTGEQVTCSKTHNQDLFNAVLGGLGQFGIITRARIPLSPAPEKVKWIRLMYIDIVAFTRDQEHLISVEDSELAEFLKYLEGSLLMEQGLIDSWRSSSFFSKDDIEKIAQLMTKQGLTALYSIELVVGYDGEIAGKADQVTAKNYLLFRILESSLPAVFF
jgi:cytokinin dehydrogenase